MADLTDYQQQVLAIIPKISGPFSMAGSSWILYEILRDKSKWRKPYHRLLFSMCVLDFFASFAFFCSTWPIPTEESDRWGASGTLGTCNAQGFMLQANIASPIYNFMLTWYFLLKVRYSYTDEQIQKCIEPLMQGFTIIFGLGTALVCLGLDLYADSSLWCWINGTPVGCEQSFRNGFTTCDRGDNAEIFRWAFFFAPLWAVAVGAMITMGLLYQYVHQTEKVADSWDAERSFSRRAMEQELESQRQASSLHMNNANDHSNGDESESQSHASALPIRPVSQNTSAFVHDLWKRRKTEQRKKKEFRKSKIVARQAYRYIGVFYITWMAGTLNRLFQVTLGHSYFWIMVLHAIFTPLQGFFNWFVYMYPKWQEQRLLRNREVRRMRSSSVCTMEEAGISPANGSTRNSLADLRSISMFGFKAASPSNKSMPNFSSTDRHTSAISAAELSRIEEIEADSEDHHTCPPESSISPLQCKNAPATNLDETEESGTKSRGSPDDVVPNHELTERHEKDKTDLLVYSTQF